MRQIKKLVVISVLLTIITTGCSYLRPEPEVKIKTKTEKIKVAVVNKDKIWTESKKAQQYQQQLEKKMNALETESQNGKSDSNKSEQQLMTEINKTQTELRDKFKQEIQSAIEKIMSKEGYDIVLDKQQVKYGGTDITQQVIKQLDNK